MQIVVDHLTRMRPGQICVAGLDLRSHTHIRPVLPHGNLPAAALGWHGGPFAVGGLIELGAVRDVGCAPEVEDREFRLEAAVNLGRASASSFWRLLHAVARPALGAIFGDVLQRHGGTLAADEGAGVASLGVWTPPARPQLVVDRRGKLRLITRHRAAEVRLPVTDVRLVEEDFQTPRRPLVEDVAARMRRGEAVLLAVGLTRPWRKDGDTAPRHWVQVNTIYLENDPIWNPA